jgi:hypothetical protein
VIQKADGHSFHYAKRPATGEACGRLFDYVSLPIAGRTNQRFLDRPEPIPMDDAQRGTEASRGCF